MRLTPNDVLRKADAIFLMSTNAIDCGFRMLKLKAHVHVSSSK
jgi:uroporphyrinogen-III synthase